MNLQQSTYQKHNAYKKTLNDLRIDSLGMDNQDERHNSQFGKIKSKS